MITLKEWSTHIRSSVARAESELTIAVAANAQLGAEIARQEIGHLQPPLTIGAPIPTHMPRWDPLAARTIRDKTKLGFGPPEWEPLRRTGQMHSSIEGVSIGLTGAVGSSDPVAVYAELGTVRQPPRPFLARAVAMTMPIFARSLGKIAMTILTPGK